MPTPDLPDRVALTEALSHLGLPPPDRISRVGQPWRHRIWRLGFPEGTGAPDVLLRAPTFPETGDTIARELAALTVLRHHDLPRVQRYHRIDALGFPAAVHDLLPGRTGGAWLAEATEHGADVVRAVGDVLRQLGEIRQPSFGTRAIGNRFVPTRGSWASTWRARVDRLALQAAQGGGLGAVGRGIEAAIESRMGALRGVMDFALVHGDLQPGNLLFAEGDGGSPVLSGVIDWESAMAGDPLVDWALLLLIPDGTLGYVMEGYGPDHARVALAEPGAHERIELYFLTHLLERLAFAAGPHLAGDPVKRNGARALVDRLWTDFHGGRGARERLEEALVDGGSGIGGLPRPRLEAILRHGLADALARGAVNDPASAWTWVGVARAVTVAELAPLGRQGWLELAISLMKRLDAGVVRPGAPIPDHGAFQQALVARALAGERAQPGGPGTVVALLGAALELDEALGGAMSDAAWHGLEEAVHGLLALGTDWREGASVSAPVQLAHGVIGLAALHPLAEVLEGGRDDEAVVAARTGFANQTGAAWNKIGGDPVGGELLDLLDAGPPSVGEGREPALTPAICGALGILDRADALPVPAAAIARVLGLGSAV